MSEFMREAIALAMSGRGLTHPNPTVGAVVVRRGKVVGRGYHHGPGTPHAEVEALREAGLKAEGADLYVTLEPCCTFGRTPPCTGAIVESGIRRLFSACDDPNPRVRSRGIQALKAAGIDVRTGLLARQAREANLPYHTFYEKGRPFVHLKWAQSLDGKSVRPGGGYLTGEAARAQVHADRFFSDAIMVTASTVIADNPLLTVRHGAKPKALLRVLLDRRARLNGRERVFSTCPGEGPILLVRPEGASGMPAPRRKGVSVLHLPAAPDGTVALAEVLRALAARKIVSLYVEAVGRLSWSFLREGLVDRLSVHVAPVLVGGLDTMPALGGEAPLQNVMLDLSAGRWRRLGKDRVITADFPNAAPLPPGPERVA